MKNLFDPLVVDETTKRIRLLQAESERRWGSMNIAQTVAHCTSGIEMAMGGIEAQPAPFPARLIGRFIKPLVFRGDQPMRRNSPSSPELFIADPTKCDLEIERSRLIAAIENFCSQGSKGCSRRLHPFFGPLKPEEWAILMYKHIHHHLRQFGV